MQFNIFAREMLVRWVEGVRKRAWLTLAIAFSLTAAALTYTATNMEINTDTAGMLSDRLAYKKLSNELRENFPQSTDNLVLVIDGRNPDKVEDAGNLLAERLRARDDVFQTVFDPKGNDFFRKNGLLYLKEKDLSELSDRLATAQPLLGSLYRDPSLRGLTDILGLALDEALKGNDGVAFRIAPVLQRIADVTEAQARGEQRTLSWKELMAGKDVSDVDGPRFIDVRPVLDFNSLQPAAKAISEAREMAREAGITPENGLRLRITGQAAMAQEELRTVREGMGVVGFISLTLVVLLLSLGFRSFRLVAATFVTLLMGLSWTAAFALLSIGHLTLISVAFAVLFIGLSVDFGIHFGLRHREEGAKNKKNGEALRTAVYTVGGALGLSALAAAIGFYSFLPTDYTGLAELGAIAGTGMFIAFIANLTVLPALISVFPPRYKLNNGQRGGRAWHTALMSAVRAHGKVISIGALLVGLAAAAALPWARFDFDPLNLKDPKTESVSTFLDIKDEIPGGPYKASVLTQDLKSAREVAEKVEKLDVVSRTITLMNFVPQNQDEKLAIIDNLATFISPSFQGTRKPPPSGNELISEIQKFKAKLSRIPVRGESDEIGLAIRSLRDALAKIPEDAAALTRLQERLLGTLPGRLESLELSLEAQPVLMKDLPKSLIDRFVAMDNRQRVEIEPALDLTNPDNLEKFVKPVRAVAPNVTGPPVAIYDAGKAVVSSMRDAALIAVGLILVLMTVLLRRADDVLLVFLPLVLAAVLTIAFSVALNLPFNFANVIVLPLLFGLGVASGIHLVMRERKEGGRTSVLETSTPRAVVFSALTTIGSFGSLALSNHPGTASMGKLLAVAIGLTLLTTLVVLPALMALRRNYLYS